MFDLLFRDVVLYDGTGGPPSRKDVGIRDQRIEAVGDLSELAAGRTVDGGGRLSLAPGMIDVHTHADLTLLSCPGADSMVAQGVTTVVGGNCGSSPAPVGDWWPLSFWEYDVWHDLVDYKYKEPTGVLVSQYRTKLMDRRGYDIDWRDFGGFLERLETVGVGVNLVPLVGHNAIRMAVIGPEPRAPHDDDLRLMQRLAAEAMEAGAFGLSSGLDYEPGAVADSSEVSALAAESGRRGGIYATHWRGSGITKGARTQKQGLPRTRIEGIIEAIAIGFESESRVLLSHLHGGWSVDPEPPDELARAVARQTMAPIRVAREQGLDITFDVIPSTVGGVLAMPYLASYLAPWLREAGSLDRFARLLRARDRCAEIRELIEQGRWWNLNPRINRNWARMLRVDDGTEGGASVADIAGRRGLDPLDAVFDLIRERPDVAAWSQGSVSSAGVCEYLSSADSLVGSDGCAFRAGWEIEQLPGFRPHGNNFGAMAGFLCQWRPGELGDAIAQVTSRPAAWFGLHDRGEIRPGAFADVFAFTGEYGPGPGGGCRPGLTRGVKCVLVNGQPVLWEGELTGKRPGSVLRRTG